MKKIVIGVIVLSIVGAFIVLWLNNTQPNTSNTEQVIDTPSDIPQTVTSDAPSDSIPRSVTDGIDDVVNKLTTVLSSGNASSFQDLLVKDDVVLGEESAAPQTVSKTDAVTWLNHHWTSNLVYVSKQYVEHFGYWEITTKGWTGVPSEEVDFRLFRYDANGQRQAFSGNWLIYGIVYQ